MKYIKSLIKRTIISVILFFLLFYALNSNNKLVKNIVLDNKINFAFFKKSTYFLVGNILKKKVIPVNDNKFVYKEIIKNDHTYIFKVDDNAIIYSFCNGIITDIKKYSLVINCDQGYDIYLDNIQLDLMKVYDSVDKSTIIGSARGNYLELTLKKDDKYLNYEEIS